MYAASVAAFLITLIITGPFQTEASRPTRKENAEGILAHKECPVRTSAPFENWRLGAIYLVTRVHLTVGLSLRLI